jgi:alpha-1,3-rhamnosyl/mannosyltransferase
MFMTGPVGGMSIAACGLIGGLREVAPDVELVLYTGADAISLIGEQQPWAGEVTLVSAPVGARVKSARVGAELTWLPARAQRDRLELLHSLGNTGPILTKVPSVVTVYDLIFRHFPATHPPLVRAGFHVVLPGVVRRARRVICPSHATRVGVEHTLLVDPGRIDVVPLGIGRPPTVAPTPEAELRRRYGLPRGEIVLTIACGLSHKNTIGLVEAMESLAPARDAILVHVGDDDGPLREQLLARARELGLEGRVHSVGVIDQPDLEGFYACARVYVQPSLMEGFGMPVLEAMRREVPVACSNTSALAEVAGDAAEPFDPNHPASIAAAVGRVLDDPDRRAELIDRGRRRWPTFSWRRTAQETLAVYDRALGLAT